MFTNIGGKIKLLAKILCWIGIISSIITALVMFILDGAFNMDGVYVGIGFAVLVVGCLGAWVSSWLAYSWGETVENVQAIRNAIAKDGDVTIQKQKSVSELDTLLAQGLISQEEYNKAINKEML